MRARPWRKTAALGPDSNCFPGEKVETLEAKDEVRSEIEAADRILFQGVRRYCQSHYTSIYSPPKMTPILRVRDLRQRLAVVA